MFVSDWWCKNEFARRVPEYCVLSYRRNSRIGWVDLDCSSSTTSCHLLQGVIDEEQAGRLDDPENEAKKYHRQQGKLYRGRTGLHDQGALVPAPG